MSKQLAELLLKDKIISQEQFNQMLTAAKSGKSMIRHLLSQNLISETKLLYYLGQKFGLPSINLTKFEINAEILKLIPRDLCIKNQIIPIQANKGTIVVALCDPSNIASFESLKFVLKSNIEAVLTSYSAFDASISKYFGTASVGVAIESFKKEQAKEKSETSSSIDIVQIHEIDVLKGSVDQDAPVIAAVNGILTEAVRSGASDIHVEPYENQFRVRMRVDGVLYETHQLPMEMKRAIVARLKIMSRMDLAESRIPQDGRIKIRLGDKDIDFRVNTVPILFGEKVVLRILNKGSLQLDLSKLGFEKEQLAIFSKGIHAPNGMVLVTGPTGSGKTTTLYSALAELNKTTDNLSTVEDPIEYNLEGINQIQTHKEIGLTFAAVLRSLLRQDPDTILVGEIRDYETAEVAIQAALTGHLVLSTLHTNDAPGTITRLMNMGLEPFLVCSSTNVIVAQRLLRTVCGGCKKEEKIPPAELVKLGFLPEQAATIRCFSGKGCSKCNNTGYKGRIAVYEVLDFSTTLKEMVLNGASVIDLRKQAIKEGMKSLRMSALTKVAEGKTSLEEAIAMTMEN